MGELSSAFDGGNDFDASSGNDDIGEISNNEIPESIEFFEDDTIDLNDVDEVEPVLDGFEQKIEALSLDELNIEREKLVEMGALDGEELARQYDELIAEQAEQERFEGVTDGLSKEQIEEMKSKLLVGNEEMLDVWGLNNDSAEDTGDAKVLKRQ